MLQIPIAAIPNQTFSTNLDNRFYNITLKSMGGITTAIIERDGVIVVQNTRVVSGSLVIPYKYLENGNFFMTTLNQVYPSYEQFGISQFLIYLSPDELNVLRAS